MAPELDATEPVRDARLYRKTLEGRLNSASVRLEAYCLLSDVLRERLEAIEIDPNCHGECRRCADSDACATKGKLIALEASIADLNRELGRLQKLLASVETGRR